MPNQLLILVTGAPATGKTTLSKNLAQKFNLPIINKDEIKELLFDTLGIKDKEWALRLGMSSFELTFFFMEKLLQTSKPFIVEANFDNINSKEPLVALASKYNYNILQLYCYCDYKVLYKRYKERDDSGDRHPGHSPLTLNFEDYKKLMEGKAYKLYIDKSKNIHIDTTDFSTIDFNKIYNQVGETLTSLKDFPKFMKNEKNHISADQQNTQDIDGYFFQGNDGSQMAFWTYYSDKISKEHTHDFDEYMVCVCGQYTVFMNGQAFVLNEGDELFIPKGTVQSGKCCAGTRTIHSFGGKRINK